MTETQARPALDLALTRPHLLRALAQNWWLLLLRGVASIAFGILAFSWPGLTLLTLTLLWGAYALADGVPRASGRDIRQGRRDTGALVARLGWHRQLSCRRHDVLLARDDDPGAADVHGQLGNHHRRAPDLGAPLNCAKN